MDPDTLAELELLRDAARLSAKAREHGVSAYLGRGKPPRLNSAFLANTVCNMEQANRRVEENAMWARRRAELGQEETSGKEDSDEARKGRECLRSDEKSMKSDGRVEEMQESAFRAWIESAPKKGRGSVGSALADGKEEYMVGQHRKEYFSSGEESNLSLESNDSIRKKKKRKKKRHKERDDGSRKSKKRHHKHR